MSFKSPGVLLSNVWTAACLTDTMLSGLLFIAAMAGKALAAQQDFVMWPWMNPDSMSASLDVDSTCLNAM